MSSESHTSALPHLVHTYHFSYKLYNSLHFKPLYFFRLLAQHTTNRMIAVTLLVPVERERGSVLRFSPRASASTRRRKPPSAATTDNELPYRDVERRRTPLPNCEVARSLWNSAEGSELLLGVGATCECQAGCSSTSLLGLVEHAALQEHPARALFARVDADGINLSGTYSIPRRKVQAG